MNFHAHLNGSIIAGCVIIFLAVVTGRVDLSTASFSQFARDPLGTGDINIMLRLFALTFFMGLFPDLDTASIPRRYFFRGLFILLLFLYITKNFDLFAFVALAALTPLLHKHRGWTHWKITPWLLSFFMALSYEYYRARNAWLSDFSINNVWQSIYDHWIYVIACVAGHYTHLFLDSQAIKKIRRKLRR